MIHLNFALDDKMSKQKGCISTLFQAEHCIKRSLFLKWKIFLLQQLFSDASFFDVLLSNAMTCMLNFKSFYNKYVITFCISTLKVKEKNINKYCFCCGGFPILTERSEQLWLWNPSEMGDSCLWLEFCWLLPISLCTPSWASTLKASTANYKKK